MVYPRHDDPTDVLAPLRERVFDFANYYTGDHWDLPGQVRNQECSRQYLFWGLSPSCQVE